MTTQQNSQELDLAKAIIKATDELTLAVLALKKIAINPDVLHGCFEILLRNNITTEKIAELYYDSKEHCSSCYELGGSLRDALPDLDLCFECLLATNDQKAIDDYLVQNGTIADDE